MMEVIALFWQYARSALTSGLTWEYIALAGGFLGSVTSWPASAKIMMWVSILLLTLLSSAIKHGYKLYSGRQPLRIMRMVQGDGMYNGAVILVGENPGTLRDGAILTLQQGSDGTFMPVGHVLVVKCLSGEPIQAILLSPDASEVRKYFEEASRAGTLFASTLVTSNEWSTSVVRKEGNR